MSYEKYIQETFPEDSHSDLLGQNLDTLYIYKRCYKKWKNSLKDPKFFWLTLQDFQVPMAELDKYILFCKNIRYLFKNMLYVIETGKHSDNPNIHVHILGNYNDPKHGKRNIKTEYMKLFSRDITAKDYFLMKQWRKCSAMPPYDQWLQEKTLYLVDNENKGTHANFMCLAHLPGVRWAKGVLTSLLKEKSDQI